MAVTTQRGECEEGVAVGSWRPRRRSGLLPSANGRELTFARTDDGFVDDQTASRWDVLGQAIDGPLAGAALEPVIHVDTFWFAWGAFLPDTEVVP
jgi:hypothetical protein